jgi:dihydroorotase
MGLEKLQDIELPASADMHVHLRDGAMMEVVVPTIRAGGVDTVLVMVSFRPLLCVYAHGMAGSAQSRRWE